MDDFWVFLLVLFSIFCFFNVCARCCKPRNRRRHQSIYRHESSRRVASNRDRREIVTGEEEKQSFSAALATYDNNYVNAQAEVVRSSQSSILEAVAIKAKCQEEYQNKEINRAEMKRTTTSATNEDLFVTNEETKDSSQLDANYEEESADEHKVEVIRIGTDEVIVVPPSSPVLAEQV